MEESRHKGYTYGGDIYTEGAYHERNEYTYTQRGHEYKRVCSIRRQRFQFHDDNVFTGLRQIRKPKIKLDQVFIRDRT